MFRYGLLVAALAACHGDPIVVGDLHEVASLKAIPNRDLDLLFVIDNSGSTTDKQARLAASFPQMIDVLSQLDGGLPNLHIGVVTSDLGTSASTGASTLSVPGCDEVGDEGLLQPGTSGALDGTFIIDADDGAGGRTRNYTGELRDVFAGIAQVGDLGCGFEQHLAATRRALTNPANAGFIRPEASLGIVIIADEDDCSVRDPAFFSVDTDDDPRQSFRCTRHGVTCDAELDTVGPKSRCAPREDSLLIEGVQPFVDAVLAVKPDPRMVMVAGVVGDLEPFAIEQRDIDGSGEPQLALAHSCVFDGPHGPEVADPAVRLAAFVDAFHPRSTLTSICSDDLTAPLVTIGESAKQMMGDPCLDTTQLADASPDPGVQPACEVVDVRDAAPDAPRELPPCTAGATDCFELVPDPAACPATPDHLRIRFHRSAVTDDTWTSVRCQLRG